MPGNVCSCGCQTPIPDSGRWVPGHALRHAADLRRRANSGDRMARRELYARGWSVTSNNGILSMYALGFEAEFFGMDQSTAVEALRAVGINAQDDGYHHEVKDYWRMTEDGSVSGEGCELVSPILHGRKAEDMRLAKVALDTLRNHGGMVNRSCGLHVHHNLRGKRVGDIAETVAHWTLFQPTIERIIPASRAAGDYSNSMHGPQNWYDSVIRHGADQEWRAIMNGSYGRYHAVNLCALRDHGTIEYRQHSGTLNPRKLEHWLKFTRAMHDVSRIGSWKLLLDLYGSQSAVNTELGIAGMCEYLGLPRRTAQFYVERNAQLYPDGTGPRNYVAHDDTGRDDEDAGEYNGWDGGVYDDGDTDDNGEGAYCVNCGEFHYEEDY